MLNPIEEIKNRLDIVEVIQQYVKLQKTGVNYRALCPFHSEKKPSFFVSPSRQIWHCFGACSEGGNIFKFIMKIEGVDFGEALKILAQKAGVELKKPDLKLKTERQRLAEINELACKFFEKQLQESKAGQEAKNYLLNRGLNEESIKKWRIGYAPESWQGLSDFLVGQGYTREEIEKAGLTIKRTPEGRNQSGVDQFYDRFRSRIIFPIFDLNSQVIGFGGRIFGKKEKEEVAKYVNIPNTLLYDKSRVLYGLDKAKLEIRKKDFAILVEGYIDAIMVSQAGFENVVATSGTALTPYQLKILKRYSENLLTAFDMDPAGDSATKRGIDLAQSQGFNVKVIMMPENFDPADLIAKDAKKWESLVNNSKSILEFYFDTTFSRFDKNFPENKKTIAQILLPKIKTIPNKIEQSFWIQKLAKELEVKEAVIEEELKKIKIEPPPLSAESEIEIMTDISFSEIKKKKDRRELLEERLIILTLKEPENINFLEEKDFQFLSPPFKEILTFFKEKFSPQELKEKREKLGEIFQKEESFPLEIKDLINYLSLKAEVEQEEEKFEKVLEKNFFQEEFQNCLKEIKFLNIKNKLDEISLAIKKAEEEKDILRVKKLLAEFDFYSKTLNILR